MTEFRNSRGNLSRGESPYFIGRPKLFSPETATHLVKNHNEVLTAGRREHVLAHSPIRSSNQSNSSNHTSFSFPTSLETVQLPVARQVSSEKSTQALSAVPQDIQSGLQRIKETQMGLLNELRANDAQKVQKRPYSKISEESIGNFESSKHSRDEETMHQKRKLQAELTLKMKRIQELLYSERELQKAVHSLKNQLESRKSEKSIEQIPNTSQGPLLDRFQQDVIFYKGESEKLMAENVRLKKQLLLRDTDSYEKTSKSQQIIPDICSFTLNERSIRADNSNHSTEYINLIKTFDEQNNAVQNELKRLTEGGRLSSSDKDHLLRLIQKAEQGQQRVISHLRDEVNSEGVIESLIRSKESLDQLHRLKEKLVETLRKNDGNYDFLQIQAQYQTTFFRVTSQLENLKHKVALQAKQHKREPQKHQRELKQTNDHLVSQIISLKKYIESENQSKSKFLHQLDKSNSVNKSVFQQNEELKREIQLLRRRSIGRQDSLKMLALPREALNDPDLKRENNQLQKQILQLSQKLQQAVRLTSKGSIEGLQRQIKDRQEKIIKAQQTVEKLTKQLNSFKSQAENTRSTVKQLQSTINSLSREVGQKQRYASELQASLAPIKPKKPFILNKSIDDKQQELKEKVVQLTNESTRMSKKIAELQQQLDEAIRRERSLRQGFEQKESHLKQRITELQGRVADLQSEINNDRLVHDTSLKKYQQRIEQLESTTTSFDDFKRQHVASYQREMSKLLTLTADSETRTRAEHTQELAQVQTRYDQERNQYMTIIRQLADQKQKLEEEFQTREKDLLAKEMTDEKEISRLNAENQALKRSVQSQIQKLSRMNSEHSKTMIEKYERDIFNLTKSNQLLTNENKSMPGLQMQINNQLALIRQLQASVKDKSMVVDHLWEIKKVEYDNMLGQLKKLRTVGLS